MNPYQVLGVSQTATKEEIRAAYLTLVKKYHPDRYQDTDLKAQAEDTMKQINAAYDLLTKEPASGGSSYGGSSYGGGSYSGGSYSGSSYSGSYAGQYAAEFARVRSFINAGRIDEAEAVLAAIPTHNAEWFFLSGMCAYRRGQYSRAYEYINNACSMAPDNVEYSSVLSALRGGAERRSTVSLDDSGYCGLCSAMLCANILCRVCCR